MASITIHTDGPNENFYCSEPGYFARNYKKWLINVPMGEYRQLKNAADKLMCGALMSATRNSCDSVMVLVTCRSLQRQVCGLPLVEWEDWDIHENA